MDDEVVIRHCRLRIVRHGGWSWGPAPERLLQSATRALPELLAEKLRVLLPADSEDRHIHRLVLRIPLSLSSLLTLAQTGRDPALAASLEQVIAQQSAHALPVPAIAPLDLHARDTLSSATANAGPQTLGSTPPPDVLQLLLRWYDDSSLLTRLQHFSAATAQLWHQQLLRSLSATGNEPGVDATTLSEFIRDLIPKLPQKLAPQPTQLFLLVALMKQYPVTHCATAITPLLRQYTAQIVAGNTTAFADIDAVAATINVSTTEQPSAPGPEPPTQLKPPAPRSCTLQSENFELQVDSVLPFIAAAVLARFGYFDVLAASLDAGGALPEMPCFIQALALKMLAPAQRGWYRNPADMRNAAALAGLAEPVEGAAMHAFAHASQDSLSAADAHLYQLLKQGHDPDCALLIHHRPLAQKEAWLLSDTQGSFVFGWFTDADALLSRVGEFPGSSLLLSESAATPSLIATLSASGQRFITSLPPGRHERWRRIDARQPLWTNDFDGDATWMAKQARPLATAVQAAEAISVALQEQRPTPITQQPVPAFETSLNLAAAAALASIAWELWGQQESCHPLLTLDRLGDLGGKIICDAQRLRVYPALGRRYRDLQQQGLLQSGYHLPWLQGRSLEFTGL